jgi:8-oxo-dGTP pyrophosphatase MutT (NUDIX family)
MQQVPIYKVGVVVRLAPAGDAAARYLIVKPLGKRDGNAPYGLPRGTRMYLDSETGTFTDARDDKTALRYAEFLEDMLVTATRELEEEAGVPRELFHERNPRELGARLYHSPSGKGVYPVMWYGVNFIAGDDAKLIPAADSAEVVWMSLKHYEAHVKKGAAREGYIDILRRAESALS